MLGGIFSLCTTHPSVGNSLLLAVVQGLWYNTDVIIFVCLARQLQFSGAFLEIKSQSSTFNGAYVPSLLHVIPECQAPE